MKSVQNQRAISIFTNLLQQRKVFSLTIGKQHHLRNTLILFPVKPSEKPVSSLTKNNNLSQTQLSRIQTDYSEGTNDNVILAILVGKSTQDERHLRLPLLLLSSVFQAEAKQSAGMSEVCNEKCIIPDCRASSRSIRNCKMRKPTGRWMDLIFGDFAWFCNSFFCRYSSIYTLKIYESGLL